MTRLSDAGSTSPSLGIWDAELAYPRLPAGPPAAAQRSHVAPTSSHEATTRAIRLHRAGTRRNVFLPELSNADMRIPGSLLQQHDGHVQTAQLFRSP